MQTLSLSAIIVVHNEDIPFGRLVEIGRDWWRAVIGE